MTVETKIVVVASSLAFDFGARSGISNTNAILTQLQNKLDPATYILGFVHAVFWHGLVRVRCFV